MKLIEPKILSFVTTEKCTSACKNCCFGCSPKGKIRVSLPQMEKVVDDAKGDFPMVDICVFTGGECTLLGEELPGMVSYVNKHGLKSRIASNAHRAGSKADAYGCLADKVTVCLKENEPEAFARFPEIQISEFGRRNMMV